MAAQQIMQNRIHAHRMNDMILDLARQSFLPDGPTQRHRLDRELDRTGQSTDLQPAKIKIQPMLQLPLQNVSLKIAGEC